MPVDCKGAYEMGRRARDLLARRGGGVSAGYGASALIVRRTVRTHNARHAVEPLVWDEAARRQTSLVVWPLPPEARQLPKSAWFTNRSLRWRWNLAQFSPQAVTIVSKLRPKNCNSSELKSGRSGTNSAKGG